MNSAAVPPHSDGFVACMGGRWDVALARFCCMSCMAIVLATAPADAQSGTRTACRFEAAGTAKVRAITDGRSFTLEAGREVRLAGIEVPLPPAAGESGPQAEAGLAARAALESILADRMVELYQNGTLSDRYGRNLALVSVADQGARRSVAHEMLGRGFARVSARVGDRDCAQELLAQERAARAAKLGLWSGPYYAVLPADNAAELAAERGRFTLAEGKVWSVRESGGTIYINFGRRWTQALTVTIAKRDERAFAAAGIEPKKLEARRVRVRGWIEERNGPRIEAASPEQIELAVLACVLAGCSSSLLTAGLPPGSLPEAVRQAQQQQQRARAPTSREHQRILAAYNGAYEDANLEAMLNQIVAKLVAASERPEVQYRVTILNSASINAFALPSGQLYVTRGLIALANDTSELASVLSHEMSHVTARHAAIREDQARQVALVSRVVQDVLSDPETGALALAKSKIALASFSRAQEFEADGIGVGIAARAGYDPYGAARFLISLGRNADLKPTGKMNPQPLDFVPSHPATPERVKNAQANA